MTHRDRFMTDREKLLLLNLIPEIGSNRIRQLLDALGSLEAVFAAPARRIAEAAEIGSELAEAVVKGMRDRTALDRELALAKQAGANIITIRDAAYPAQLKTIHDPPIVLYVKGDLPLEPDNGVAIVGTRAASRYGLEVARRLGYELAERGIAVVSGMAKGIDAAAHQGALKAGGPTVAVLGSGLSRIYPSEHADLAREIERKGALVSEYPVTYAPLPKNFPRRNRIISGLSRGVVVVEAAERSGAVITADQALEQGREVFAVPGMITSPASLGTHRLLKQGARLVTGVEDILEELGWGQVNSEGNLSVPLQTPPPINHAAFAAAAAGAVPEAASRVLAVLDAREPRDIDRIGAETRMSVGELSAVLLRLELARRVRQLPGKFFLLNI